MNRKNILPVLCFVLCWLTNSIYAEIITGKVISIQDGDTLTLLDMSNTQFRIRIAGIDTPEKTQPFGEQAKQHLAQLAFDKLVIATCNKKDRYDRWVCFVEANGLDVGLVQLEAGLAWWYRKYAGEQPSQQARDYEQAEIVASSNGKGLWQQQNPVPPWDWRKKSR